MSSVAEKLFEQLIEQANERLGKVGLTQVILEKSMRTAFGYLVMVTEQCGSITWEITVGEDHPKACFEYPGDKDLGELIGAMIPLVRESLQKLMSISPCRVRLAKATDDSEDGGGVIQVILSFNNAGNEIASLNFDKHIIQDENMLGS